MRMRAEGGFGRPYHELALTLFAFAVAAALGGTASAEPWVAEYWAEDCDGDGHRETLAFDLYGDGAPDQVLIDLDGDGATFEIGWFDRRADGTYRRFLSLDEDRVGRIDVDADGIADQLWVDRNGDILAQIRERQRIKSPVPMGGPGPCAGRSSTE